MKKVFLLLINVLLSVVILTSCNNSPITLPVQTPETSVQTTIEPSKQATLEPNTAGEILSFDEAQDLLFNWYEWNKVSYIPNLDKQEDGVRLYCFLVDYSDSKVEWSGHTHCYAWVNTSTEMINFEEAGYSEAVGPNLYANIPDVTFPIPMLNDVLIPYDWFSPPDYVWGVTYMYDDKSVMESYQEQLKNVGFIEQGTVQSVESLWQYERSNDGAIFTVEMYSEGEMFSMNMYISYSGDM